MPLEKTLQNAENQVATMLVKELQTFMKSRKNRFQQATRVLRAADEFKKLVELFHPKEVFEDEQKKLMRPTMPRRRPMPKVAAAEPITPSAS